MAHFKGFIILNDLLMTVKLVTLFDLLICINRPHQLISETPVITAMLPGKQSNIVHVAAQLTV